MPELDGHEVLSALRRNPLTATVPFIFLTGQGERFEVRQGMELGADDYIPKPFTGLELRQAISTQLLKKTTRESQSQSKLDVLRESITRSLPIEIDLPLSNILRVTGELLKKQGTIVKGAEGLEMLLELRESAQGLHRLLENFLLYAQIELMANDPDRVQALQESQSKCHAKLTIESLAQLKARQADREADLRLDLDDIAVLVAKSDLRKITEELIDNAIKFSAAGTPIQITGKMSNDRFCLSVTDQGSGMTAEQIANMGAFMQFERKLYEPHGTGLGLTIAKRITELYGGQLTIESVPQVATIVRVTLPMERYSSPQ
jgi:signal transduction histidine kinase